MTTQPPTPTSTAGNFICVPGTRDQETTTGGVGVGVHAGVGVGVVVGVASLVVTLVLPPPGPRWGALDTMATDAIVPFSCPEAAAG